MAEPERVDLEGLRRLLKEDPGHDPEWARRVDEALASVSQRWADLHAERSQTVAVWQAHRSVRRQVYDKISERVGTERGDLRTELEWARSELERTQAELEQAHAELERAYDEMDRLIGWKDDDG